MKIYVPVKCYKPKSEDDNLLDMFEKLGIDKERVEEFESRPMALFTDHIMIYYPYDQTSTTVELVSGRVICVLKSFDDFDKLIV